MTSGNTCIKSIIGCFRLKNENPMCEHPAHQVIVSQIGVMCAPDSSKFFGTPCIMGTCHGPTETYFSHCGRYSSTPDYIFLPNSLSEKIASAKNI